METTVEWLHELGSAGVLTIWLPVGAWTVLALAVLGLFRVCDSIHPLIHYAGRVALLLALPLGLIVAPMVDAPVSIWETGQIEEKAVDGVVSYGEVTPGQMETTATAEQWKVYGLTALGFLTILAVVVALFATGWTWRSWAVLAYMRRKMAARPVPEELTELVDRLAHRYGIRRTVRVVVTDFDLPPMTFGWWNPVLVIPDSLLGESDALYMAVSHELTHIRRHDDLLQKLEVLIGNVFAVNPFVGRLRRSIVHYREISVDSAVLAHPEINRRGYVALLYRFAGIDQSLMRPVLSMAASQPELTRRLIAMKHTSHYTEGKQSPGRIAVLLSALLLGTVTLLVACTDTIGPQAEDLSAADETFVIVEQMPEPVDGMTGIMKKVTYPAVAKAAGIQGKVIVEFTVDKEGRVKDAKVKEGIGGGCDEEALRVLSETRFKPGIQRGEPVEVTLTLPFVFKLADDEARNAIIMDEPEVIGSQMRVEDIKTAEGRLTGRVIDAESGSGLAGVNIVVEGTNVGSVTGDDGWFALNVDDQAEAGRLVFSHVGYSTVYYTSITIQ